MKAITQTTYGSPDVLRYEEIPQPLPQAHEVLVKLHATSINAGDWHLMRGTPFLIRLIYGGLRQPKIKTLGMDLAGRVEAVGEAVSQFQPGDAVFGDLSEVGFGAFADYACVPETALAPKPENISFEQAAATPVAAIAALQALRDVGQLQAGQRVLVNGASGGVGSFAVQIAKAWGAEVTAVCSPSKLEMMQAIGADQTLDYTQTDAFKTGAQYDLILDAAAYRSVFDAMPALTPGGTYILVGGGSDRFFQTLFLGPLISRFSRRQVRALASAPNAADLNAVRALLATGKIVPFIDRTYPLPDVPEAIRYVEERHVRGKVVINIETSDQP
ncbi:MAG: NAD(P)-dependent alcohol dehydrogenase [Cyanobacteria bacterium P01_G01_bin.54]